MKKAFHAAETRGNANHGWLNATHSFSFANYHNPDRMNFGALRVLNDDTIAAGMGFGTHPHENMEIITIPMEGDLEHKDSMGNIGVINEGEIQVMSAGTGVHHSEYNKNADQAVKVLQLWVFPKKQNVTPRYDQMSVRDLKKPNDFYQVLSPNSEDEGMWVHQDTWFHLGEFDVEQSLDYTIKQPGNGVYVFVIQGSFNVEGENLKKRDAIGIWDTETINFTAQSESKVLLVEVPMRF